MVFSVLKDILKLQFLNSFVKNFVSLPMYANLYHFLLVFFFYLVLYFILEWICSRLMYHLLLYSIRFIVFSPFSLSVLFIVYVVSLLFNCLIAANLCSEGWYKSHGIMVCVVVGFPVYTEWYVFVFLADGDVQKNWFYFIFIYVFHSKFHGRCHVAENSEYSTSCISAVSIL